MLPPERRHESNLPKEPSHDRSRIQLMVESHPIFTQFLQLFSFLDHENKYLRQSQNEEYHWNKYIR